MTKAYRAMQEGIRDEDPEKGTEERKKRLEKKRGMKMDDHPQYAKEALDPVGKEDGDVNNDGKKDDTDSYLMKRRKAIGSAMKKRLKEERASLSEVMTDKEDEKKVVEKKVNNTVVINPKLSEAVEELGGEVLEMVEVEGENIEEIAPALVAGGAAALAAAPYLMKKFLKPKVDKALDKQRKTAPIGGDRRVPQMNSVEVDGDMVQEAGGPALPGEPGRPGTPKAPGGRPHLPGEKQTPKPKKAGMLRLAHTEYSDWRSDLQEGPYVVTNADKKGNTPAYQGLLKGKKNAITGKPLYVAAPHLKLANSHELEGEDLQEIRGQGGRSLGSTTQRNVPPARAPKPAPVLRGQGGQPLRRSGDPGRTSQPTTRINRSPSPAPTPSPSPTSAAKPTPSPKPTPKPVASSPKPTKTPNPLLSRGGSDSVSSMIARSKARQAQSSSKPKTTDIRDRDITARASYDPRLKSERQRMKQIKAGRRMREEVEGENLQEKRVSVDDQMKISQEHNRKSAKEKREANEKIIGKVKKVKREKDKRTDAQKMTDATGPRPGSRYRGD